MKQDAIPTTIPEAEFTNWLSPAACFRMLSPQWSYEIIRSTILRHLIHEQMFSRAGTLIIEGNAPKATYHFALVPVDAWKSDQPAYSSHFWENGLFDFSIGFGHDEREFSCFDVRFDPAVIRSLILGASESKQTDAAEKAKRRQDFPVLPEPIAQAWMAWYKVQPGCSKDGAERSALQMFPNHNLSRERIRELFGDASMGRPRKTGD